MKHPTHRSAPKVCCFFVPRLCVSLNQQPRPAVARIPALNFLAQLLCSVCAVLRARRVASPASSMLAASLARVPASEKHLPSNYRPA